MMSLLAQFFNSLVFNYRSNDNSSADSLNLLGQYVQFLIPSDATQTVFLWIIAILSVIAIICVLVCAKKKNWKKNWVAATSRIKAEHGSILELCDAVATKSERYANVLPNLLLVIGLLGTFLGVGFALNNAAGALNGDADGATKINKMIPMLQDLGTLFKSSIYGIIGFFVVTSLNAMSRTGRKRLGFCVSMVNEEIQKRNEELDENRKKEFEKYDSIIESLQNVSTSLGQDIRQALIDSMSEGFGNVKDNLIAMNESLGTALSETLKSSFNDVNKTLTQVSEKTGEMLVKQKNAIGELKKIPACLTAEFKVVQDNLTSMNESLGNTLEQTLKSSFNDVNKTLTQVSEKTSEMLAKQESTIGELKTIPSCLTEQFDSVNTSLQMGFEKVHLNLEQMNSSFGSSLQETVNACFNKVSVSLNELSSGIQKKFSDMAKDFEKVSDAAQEMKTSAECMSNASGALKNSVDAFGPQVQNALNAIKEDFIACIERSSSVMQSAGESIKTEVEKMSQETSKGQAELNKTLNDFKTDMGDAITKINGACSQMRRLANSTTDELGKMRDEISNKIGSVSRSNIGMQDALKNLGSNLAVAIDEQFGNAFKSIDSTLTQLNNLLTGLGEAISVSIEEKFGIRVDSIKNEISGLVQSNNELIESINEMFRQEKSGLYPAPKVVK